MHSVLSKAARRFTLAIGSLALAGGFVPGLATNAWAVKFTNQFIEFELPPQWQCNLEGAEWVCQSGNDEKKRDAIIVLAAKLKGDQDTLDRYEAYLKNPRAFVSVQGKQMRSEVKYEKSVSINNQAWVDSLHLESEIPGFYTRYLATVKNDIGVLVTYSINKNKYAQYLNDFDAMVATLKVFRKPGVGLNARPGTDLTGVSNIPAENASAFQNIEGGSEKPSGSSGGGGGGGLPLPLIIGGAAVAFFLWRRSRSSAE